MNKIFRIAAIAIGVVMCWSCCLDMDYDYNHVTPPTVVLDSPSVVGFITDKAGAPIAGATVKVGNLTATTDAAGYYVIENVTPGNYPVIITATGYIDHEGKVVVASPNGEFVICKYSTTLSSISNYETLNIIAGGPDTGTVSTEHLKSNSLAGIKIDAAVTKGTVPGNVDIKMIPIYDESEAVVVTKASSNDYRLLVGIALVCDNSSLTFAQPIIIEMHCDVPLTQHIKVKHLKGGVWVDIPYSANAGLVKIEATELGSYALFLPFIMKENPRQEALTFTPDVWDNLYGNGAITAESVSFNYFAGTRINSTATDVLSALLIEKIAYYYGAQYQQQEGVYPLNVRLPLGSRLTVSGAQNVTDVIATYSNWSVNGTYFGDTMIYAKTTNRQHNGGNGGQY